MYYYHGTTKESAEEIMKSKLEKSKFDLRAYLNYTLKNSGKLEKGYEDSNSEYNRVKWLGEGIYLFDFLNKNEAIGWCNRYIQKVPLSECTALRIKMKEIPEKNIFDFFSYSDLNKVRITFKDKFLKFFENSTISGDDLKYLLYIQKQIEKQLNILFQDQPFYGGVAIDLYNFVSEDKIKLVRGIYRKGNKYNYYDVYYCLKDDQYIEEINII